MNIVVNKFGLFPQFLIWSACNFLNDSSICCYNICSQSLVIDTRSSKIFTISTMTNAFLNTNEMTGDWAPQIALGWRILCQRNQPYGQGIRTFRNWVCISVVQHLPHMCKTLDSILSMAKNKTKQELSLLPLNLQREERGCRLSSITNGQRFNQSCVHYENVIKPKQGGSESFGIAYPCAGRVAHLNSTGSEVPGFRTLFDLVIYTSSSCRICVLIISN